MTTLVDVVGDAPAARVLRHELHAHGCRVVGNDVTSIDALVVVPAAHHRHCSIEEYSDADFAAAWEEPMRAAVTALCDARRRGARRMVIVIGTSGMTGAATDALNAMASEGLHALAKSAARQWGPEGITVNVVAISPNQVGALDEIVSLAPLALPVPDQPATGLAPLVAFACSESAGRLTGSTLVADGGSWMP